MRIKLVLLCVMMVVLTTMTGCISEVYNSLVSDNDAYSASDNYSNYDYYGYYDDIADDSIADEKDTISVNGEEVYNAIVEYAESVACTEVYFPPYAETNFPDVVSFVPTNTKIKQGVYATYKYENYDSINYLYASTYTGDTLKGTVIPTVYCDNQGGTLSIIYIDLVSIDNIFDN